MLGNDKLSLLKLKQVFKRFNYALIGGHAALERHRLLELLAFAQVAYVVSGQGVTQPGHYVRLGDSLLLKVYHVGFGEDAAPAGDGRRPFRFEGQVAEFPVYGDSQAVRLLIEE